MNTTEENQLQSRITEMVRQAMAQTGTSPAPIIAAPGAAPLMQQPTYGPAPTQFGGVQPVGLLVAINIPTPQGNASAYLQLPAAALANPQAAIAALQAQGWPVRTYGGGNDNGNRFSGRRSWGQKTW